MDGDWKYIFTSMLITISLGGVFLAICASPTSRSFNIWRTDDPISLIFAPNIFFLFVLFLKASQGIACHLKISNWGGKVVRVMSRGGGAY